MKKKMDIIKNQDWMTILIQFVMKGMAWKMKTNKGGNWLIAMATNRPIDYVDVDSDSNSDSNVDSDVDSDSDVDVVYFLRMGPHLD